jgi:VanZ family protein
MIRFAPALIWMMVIFVISSQRVLPGPKSAEIVWWDFLAKKTAHMVEYAILYYFWQRGFHYGSKPNYKGYLWAFIIVVLYAVTDEFHQSFIAGRHPKVYDVGYDALGAGLMYLKLRKWI